MNNYYIDAEKIYEKKVNEKSTLTKQEEKELFTRYKNVMKRAKRDDLLTKEEQLILRDLELLKIERQKVLEIHNIRNDILSEIKHKYDLLVYAEKKKAKIRTKSK